MSYESLISKNNMITVCYAYSLFIILKLQNLIVVILFYAWPSVYPATIV